MAAASVEATVAMEPIVVDTAMPLSVAAASMAGAAGASMAAAADTASS
jgi:hypothetical protein